MMKLAFSVLCVGGCLLALPAAAVTPQAAPPAITTPLSGEASPPAQAGVIKIGEHFCPTVPENAISGMVKKTLTLVSTTCVMEASGLITHDEAQAVYEQALSNIQVAMAEIQTDDAGVPGSTSLTVASK